MRKEGQKECGCQCGLKWYVFVLHLYCGPQGCSRYLARSHVAVSLGADSTLATSCPASHLITLTVRQLLWEISFTTADAQAYASNPRLEYICHFCLSKAKKMSSNLGHKFTFLVTSWWEKRNHIDLHLKVNQNVKESWGLNLLTSSLKTIQTLDPSNHSEYPSSH